MTFLSQVTNSIKVVPLIFYFFDEFCFLNVSSLASVVLTRSWYPPVAELYPNIRRKPTPVIKIITISIGFKLSATANSGKNIKLKFVIQGA